MLPTIKVKHKKENIGQRMFTSGILNNSKCLASTQNCLESKIDRKDLLKRKENEMHKDIRNFNAKYQRLVGGELNLFDNFINKSED